MSGVWRLASGVVRGAVCLMLVVVAWAGDAPAAPSAAPAVTPSAAPASAPAAVGGFRIGAEAGTARFFSEKIAPVFAKHCYECHGGKKRFGGLKMDSLEGALKGGHDSGPGIVPWNPDKSSIVVSMRWTSDDEDMRMPPDKKLPDAVVADVARWVAMGAPWPVDAPAVVAAPETRAPLFGRLHPAFVHVPIAVLLLAAIFELLTVLKGDVWRPAVRASLLVTAIGCVASIVSGIGLGVGKGSPLLDRHELAGWITLALVLTTLLADWSAGLQPGRRRFARLLLIASLVAVALTGHWGGEMVHGSWW